MDVELVAAHQEAPVVVQDFGYSETKFAGEVKGFEVERYLDRKEARRMDRFTHLALASAKEAFEQSGLEITPAIARAAPSPDSGGEETWWASAVAP